MKRIIALVLVLAVLLMPAALADVRRGDRGEEVYELQELLFRLGWLFEEPDGIFGRNTESAVKQYQRYVGLPQSGVATDELLDQLRVDWDVAQRELYGGDEYDGNGEYEEYVAPVYCETSIYNGMLRTDFCAEHVELLSQDADLWIDGVEGMRAANALWEDAIDEFHEHLQAIAPAERQLELLSAIAAWKANVEAQRAALAATMPDNPERAEDQLNQLLKARMNVMCGISGGAMEWRFTDLDEDDWEDDGEYVEAPADDYEMEGQALEDGGEGCVAWAEDLGIEFVSLCPDHAMLMNRLRMLVETGAGADAMRTLLTDWEDDLGALYDRWADKCPQAMDAILEAKDSFINALDWLDRVNAGASDGFIISWRLNAVARESLRLCAIVNDTDIYAY